MVQSILATKESRRINDWCITEVTKFRSFIFGAHLYIYNKTDIFQSKNFYTSCVGISSHMA